MITCEKCHTANPPQEEHCTRCYAWLPSPETALFSGTRIRAKYEILEVFGRDRGRTLYRGRHLLLDRMLLLEMIPPALLANAEDLQRFREEVATLSAIEHPNLLRVLDADETEDGVPFLVYDFPDGVFLEETLKTEERFSVERAVALVAQMLEGLEALHNRGCVHGELSPKDILLVPQEEGKEVLKITDFSPARFLEKEKGRPASRKRKEVLPYLSPDQLGGEAPNPGADLWSAGVILYQLLSGVRPFAGERTTDLIFALQDELLSPSERGERDSIPKELDALCLRALHDDPGRRPQTAAAFRKMLLRIPLPSATEPEPAETLQLKTRSLREEGQDASGEPSLPKPRARSRVLLWVGSAAALAGGVALFGGFFSNNHTAPSPSEHTAISVRPASFINSSRPAQEAPLSEEPEPEAAPTIREELSQSAPKSAKEPIAQPTVRKEPAPASPRSKVPGNTAEKFTLAKRRILEGRLVEAARLLEEVVVEDPQNPYPHRRLGDVYLQLGKKERALREWRIFVQLAPSHPDVERVKNDILLYSGKSR